MKESRVAAGLAAVGWIVAGCASVPAPDRRAAGEAASPDGPRISWEIRAGGDFGDARSVCSSEQPKPDCTLASQRNGARSLATVRVYLHAASKPTRYLGSVAVPFVAGGGGRTLDEINMTVPSNSSPVGATVNGQVTSDPGVYRLDIALDAIQVGDSTPVRLARDIPVTVTAAATP